MPATRSRTFKRAPQVRERPASDTAEVLRIGPQPGPQEEFFRSPADIIIYGGQAGGGKTWALLFEGMRHKDNPEFGYVIFRRISTQITNQGGLWDESMKLYPLAGGSPRSGSHDWFFPSGAWIGFNHMQYEADKLQHQGAAYAAIGFDELTHFTESQFFYMLSRNRSMSGVPGYIRATTNPDPDSWVAEFIAWWIDQRETVTLADGRDIANPMWGLPIPERAGSLRWFVRISDELHWADTREELLERFAHLPPEQVLPKSLTFIPAKLSDNPALMRADPGYLANLMALPYVERERLLGGNWKVRAGKGKVFPRSGWRVVPAIPKGPIRWVRYWDKAGSSYDQEEAKKDHTSGLLMGWHSGEELWYIRDVVRGQWEAAERERTMVNTAHLDGQEVEIWVEQEPGSGGKDSAFASVKNLRGFRVHVHRVGKTEGDKLRRAEPLAAQQQVGNVCLVRPPGEPPVWLAPFVAEMESFPTKGIPDDQVDSASGAFNVLSRAPSWGASGDWNTVKK